MLDRDALQWYPVAGLLRQAAKAGVPALTRPRRVPPGVRVVTVASRLIGAIAPWWLRKKKHRYRSPEDSRADISGRLRRAAEWLGPTHIKLGPVISCGGGVVPPGVVPPVKQ